MRKYLHVVRTPPSTGLERREHRQVWLPTSPNALMALIMLAGSEPTNCSILHPWRTMRRRAQIKWTITGTPTGQNVHGVGSRYHPASFGRVQLQPIVMRIALAALIGGTAITTVPATANPVGIVTGVKNTVKPLPNGSIRALRADRLLVDKRNRFCVTSSASAATVALIERSGEDLKSWTIESFANDTAIALTGALRRAGLPAEVAGSAIPDRVVLGRRPQTLATCKSDADTIFVSLDIKLVAGSGGYRAIVTAVQRNRRYVAQIERQSLIVMPMQGRAGISLDADSTPDGKPYWDVRHDVNRLRQILLIHLFGND